MLLKAIIYLTVEIIRESKDMYHLSLIFLKAIEYLFFWRDIFNEIMEWNLQGNLANSKILILRKLYTHVGGGVN